MTASIKIKHGAVVAANVVNFVLAIFWYGPLFGETWARGAEITHPMPPSAGANFAAFAVGLLSCYGIALLLKWAGRSGIKNGLMIGLLVAFAFLLQVVIGPWIFADRFLLFAVNMPYFALSVIIAGAIIGTWQKPA